MARAAVVEKLNETAKDVKAQLAEVPKMGKELTRGLRRKNRRERTAPAVWAAAATVVATAVGIAGWLVGRWGRRSD